jgi:regulatory protein
MTSAPTDGDGTPRISALVPDPRRPESVRVQVGGQTLLTVPRQVAERLQIQVGDAMAGPVHHELCRAADVEAALRTALKALERRPFASRDLVRRLVLKGHPPEAADQAVARAAELGLVNDEAFARHFTQTRFARGRGPARLRRELTAMGCLPALVDRVLREEIADGGAEQSAQGLARKRAGQLRGVPRPDRLRRVVAYLARRGYRGPAAVAAARAAVTEEPVSDE